MKSLNGIVMERCIKRKLPFERKTKSRPLRDILLELCARNFEDIFVEADYVNMETLKKGIKLESNLFERILDKGREINLIMPPRQVKLLLGFRKELNWQNIDLYRGCLDLTETDLEIISSCNVPVKKLAFHSNYLITNDMLHYISFFSATLEHLEIGTNCWSTYRQKLSYIERQEALNDFGLCQIKMPRLRYLKLNFSMACSSKAKMMVLSSCFETIEVLKLHDYANHDDPTLLSDLIRNCRNLIVLSLRNAHFQENEVDDIFEAIGSLKKLRTLEMHFVRKPPNYESDRFDVSRIVLSLPKLENLEISYSNFGCSDVDFSKFRLNYLGAIQLENKSISKIPANVLLSHRSFETYESLLSYFENAPAESLCFGAVVKLSAILSLNFPDNLSDLKIDKMEAAFLKICETWPGTGSGSGLSRIVNLAEHQGLRHSLSPDFWAKLIRSYVCSRVYYATRSMY